jgi:hypothetical protein
VYQHMNATALGVFWPNLASRSVTLNGRDVFEFEDIDKWVLDPDGLRSYHLSYTPEEKFPCGAPSGGGCDEAMGRLYALLLAFHAQRTAA